MRNFGKIADSVTWITCFQILRKYLNKTSCFLVHLNFCKFFTNKLKVMGIVFPQIFWSRLQDASNNLSFPKVPNEFSEKEKHALSKLSILFVCVIFGGKLHTGSFLRFFLFEFVFIKVCLFRFNERQFSPVILKNGISSEIPSVTNNKYKAVVPERCGGSDIYWLFVS